MDLLFEEEYEILKASGLIVEEDVQNRFLVIKNYPLKKGLYTSNGIVLNEIEVLLMIPPNYNTSGGDMFWTYPDITRVDGIPIPAYGGDPRVFDGKNYNRWSRHWNPQLWRSKIDNIETLLNRIEWALQNPSANR